ncbi:hypothetical protein Tco_0239533, partial [Tanacetum coccineum]
MPHNKTPYELLLDEGFLVGYSINSKAFRVFNTRTRKIEENLHIKFLENKPNVAGSGIETNVNARQTGQKKASDDEYILLPLLFDSPQSSMDAVVNNVGKKTTKKPANEGKRNGQEKEGGAS